MPRAKVDPRSEAGLPEVPEARPMWTRRDARHLATLPLRLAAAWVLPQQRWEALATRVVRRRLARRPDWLAGELASMRALIGEDLPDRVWLSIFERHAVCRWLLVQQLLRCYRTGAWRPELRLEGRERIEAALARGRGAILWVAPLAFATLATKMTCHEAGLAVSHLSRWSHGFSNSRLGSRLLNPVQRCAEDRFLSERIVIGPGEPPIAATRALAQRLRRNRIISITIGPQGAAPAIVPFLAGTLTIARGAPKLALATGAALLPVFTTREPDGGFRTVVEAPLVPVAGEDPAESVIRACARNLAVHALRNPEQFPWYDRGLYQPPDPPEAAHGDLGS